eukprot:gb/GEZN01003933.1/.p1 GENE.gb/GEZN01003933.1/~~gb/GEZN01003933.1/.p1  ORF type:complete len:668 (-),score=54.91 gb/GEZN01003933.1/:61-1989(-)
MASFQLRLAALRCRRSTGSSSKLLSLRHHFSPVASPRFFSSVVPQPTAHEAVAPHEKKSSFPDSFMQLLPKTNAAPETYNRWSMVPSAMGIHLCLGSIYTFSLINDPLTKFYGVVGPASMDWSLTSVVPLFTTILVLQGLSAAAVGKWQQKVGMRAAGLVGAFCFGGGHILAGLCASQHFLPGMFLGYGVLAGSGIGLSYTPPMSIMLAWFKDRPGLATGMTIMGFGGGALVFGPAINILLRHFSKEPLRLGHASELALTTSEAGIRFAEVGGQLQEVIEVSTKEIASSSLFSHLQEGVYLVGSGSTGIAETLTTLGGVYLVIMSACALSFKLPSVGYNPGGASSTLSTVKAPEKYVPVDNAMSTPQFWRVWVTFGGLATAGLGVLSVAKTMMSEIFGSSLPDIVTPSFAAAFVLACSAANLSGRLGWSAASDIIGVKNVFTIFTTASIPLYLAIPWCTGYLVETGGESVVPLAVFYGSTLCAITIVGGGYSTTPAYQAHLFGTKEVGAIHGRMLTASAAGGVLGPVAITQLRQYESGKAILELASKVQPETFETKFGAPLSSLDDLVASRTVTIENLLTLCPPDTLDPTPYLYNSTMYSAAALISLAAVANAGIKPVAKQYFMIDGKPIKEWEDAQVVTAR